MEDMYRFFEGFIMTSHPVMEARDVRGSPLALIHGRAATPWPLFHTQCMSATSRPLMEAEHGRGLLLTSSKLVFQPCL